MLPIPVANRPAAGQNRNLLQCSRHRPSAISNRRPAKYRDKRRELSEESRDRGLRRRRTSSDFQFRICSRIPRNSATSTDRAPVLCHRLTLGLGATGCDNANVDFADSQSTGRASGTQILRLCTGRASSTPLFRLSSPLVAVRHAGGGQAGGRNPPAVVVITANVRSLGDRDRTTIALGGITLVQIVRMGVVRV